jgi:hypothetical protein
MDRRGVLKGRVGHSCIHHVEHAVNGFSLAYHGQTS